MLGRIHVGPLEHPPEPGAINDPNLINLVAEVSSKVNDYYKCNLLKIFYFVIFFIFRVSKCLIPTVM